MGRLGRGIEGQVAVAVVVGQGGVGLDEGGVLALVEEGMGGDVVAALDRRLEVAELLVDLGGQVAWKILVEDGGFLGQGLVDAQDGRQGFVIDLDQTDGLLGRLQIHGGHGPDLVADVAGLVSAEEGLVVAGRGDAVLDFQGIGVGDDRLDPGQPFGGRSFDIEYLGVGVGRVEDGAVEHTRQAHVVHVDRLASGLGRRVQAAGPAVDNVEVAHLSPSSPWPSAAVLTASTILW